MGVFSTQRRRRVDNRKSLIIAVVVSLLFGLTTIVAPAVAETLGKSGSVSKLLGLKKGNVGDGIEPTNQTWLERLNTVRALFNAPPVVEDPELSRTAALHATYMAKNNTVTHQQTPGKPGYSTEGDDAGKASNVGAGEAGWPDYRFIDMWATAPFHASAMLRPSLKKVGLGIVREGGDAWGALNVSTGLDWSAHPTTGWPRVFPTGPGVPYTRYWGSEWPDPTAPCGQAKDGFGLPIIVDFGGDPNAAETVTTAKASLTGPSGDVDLCVALPKDYGTGNWPLQGSQALIMPKAPLVRGATYTGSLESNRGTASISFTLGGTAPVITASPSPSATPSASASATPTPSASATPSASPSATPTPRAEPSVDAPSGGGGGGITKPTVPTKAPDPVVDPVEKPKPTAPAEPRRAEVIITTMVVKQETMLVSRMSTLETKVRTTVGSLDGLKATLSVRRAGGAWEPVVTRTLRGSSQASFTYTRVSLGVEEVRVSLAGGGNIPDAVGNIVQITYG